jgi:type I restriction enzyme S subunit
MKTGGKLAGWKVEKLGDVIQLEYGKPLDASKRSEDGKYPVYGANGEIARSNEYYYDKPTMIVGRKGSAGEINLTEKKFWALDVTYFVTFDDKKYDLQFLYYLLSKLELTKLAKGVKPGINRNDVYSIEVVIPPLPEQQRIVSVLDETFASIAQAKSNAERNLVNARELFESFLLETFEKLSSDNETDQVKIEDIALVSGGYSFKSGDFKKNGKYQVIRMGNVRPDILRLDENPVFIDEIDEDILSRSLLKPNDVIITQTGTKKKRDYGYTVLISQTNLLLNQRISVIRFSENYLPKFFLYFSWTDIFKDQYFANETGTVGQGNVGKKGITETLIPFPPLAEQRAIVGRLEALSAETGRLEEIYQQKVESLEELKKSVLGKAFEGELSIDN